jgi:subtilase family serine protease
VRFRWIAAKGRVQRERRRVTPVCRQPSQLPNLLVESLAIAPGPDAATRRYRITVANEGRTAARPFRLALVVDRESIARDVPAIAPAERTTVEIVGPHCEEGRTLRIQLDVRGAVRESREADNRSIRLCDGR